MYRDPMSRTELTRREQEILTQVALGRRNAEIARDLRISPNTVRNHLAHIYEKLGARTRSHAVALSRRGRPAA